MTKVPAIVSDDYTSLAGVSNGFASVLEQSLRGLNDDNIVHASETASHPPSQTSRPEIQSMEEELRQFLFIAFSKQIL